MTERRFEVLILGAGAGGLSCAARLVKTLGAGQVAVVDPAKTHFYQPLWTLVGGGVTPKETTARPQSEVIPRGVTWICDRAEGIDPEARAVTLGSGERVSYGQLIVALGIVIDWEAIPGLTESLGRDGVCSNYSYDSVDKTWEMIRGFKGGQALFTHPSTPIKCGGAPQKIMYLAEEAFRRQGVREASEVTFYIAKPTIFAVEKYARTLTAVCERQGIARRFQHELRALRPASKEAVFEDLASGEELVAPYDLIHVTPPMKAPALIAASGLGDAAGWCEVDAKTMQHARHPDIFALGDASNLPTSKTAAAIRKQAPILTQNLLAHRAGQALTGSYDGYTSCPLVTGYGKLVLAEFDYAKVPQETFPFDQSRERWSMYQLKRHILPALYWHGMLKGRA